jgi:hypothetical protein
MNKNEIKNKIQLEIINVNKIIKIKKNQFKRKKIKDRYNFLIIST